LILDRALPPIHGDDLRSDVDARDQFSLQERLGQLYHTQVSTPIAAIHKGRLVFRTLSFFYFANGEVADGEVRSLRRARASGSGGHANDEGLQLRSWSTNAAS